MESIALIENKICKYLPEYMNQAPKFRASISDSFVLVEDLIVIYNMLYNEYGITLDRPSSNCVYSEDYNILRNRLNKMRDLGELSIYDVNPRALTYKSLPEVIEYCQKNGINYKDEQGNYASFLFSKREYEKMGIILNKNNKSVTLPKGVKEEINEFVNDFSDELNNELKVEEPPVQEDPIKKIIDTDGNEPMDDIHTERIDRLSEQLKEVLIELVSMGLRQNDVVSSEVSNDLVKLIMADVPDDRLAIYGALVYGDKFTQEEINVLPTIINDKVNYYNINNYNKEEGGIRL